jgi:hypothetical protein
MHSTGTAFAALTLIACLSAGTSALAQAHQTTSGACTLRSSTVDSRSIPASVATRRGFSRAADLAIVDVTVSCKGRPGNGTVAADIEVTRADLAGTKESVEMHLDRQNGYVSYYGTYSYLPGQVVRLAVTAIPARGARRLTLTYQHRFTAR